MKYALCVGINDYPGTDNDLAGCVNDANDWHALFCDFFNFDTILELLDSRATICNFKEHLLAYAKEANAGDVVVITYSGHGTPVIDSSGDEEDGYDEALVFYDGLLLDDDMRLLIKNFKDGVHLVFIFDCCFSGTITRAKLFVVSALGLRRRRVPRYMPPENSIDAMRVRMMRPKKRFLEESMFEILLSGASDSEYAYDAWFVERPNGAFTRYLIDTIIQHSNESYSKVYKALRYILPSSEFPQTPQLEGATKNKHKKIFQEIPRGEIMDDSVVVPIEVLPPQRWKLWSWIKYLFTGRA